MFYYLVVFYPAFSLYLQNRPGGLHTFRAPFFLSKTTKRFVPDFRFKHVPKRIPCPISLRELGFEVKNKNKKYTDIALCFERQTRKVRRRNNIRLPSRHKIRLNTYNNL